MVLKTLPDWPNIFYTQQRFENSGTRFFYKNTWFQFQPAVSYFSVNFQPKVFFILFLIFVFEFPEYSRVKILISMVLN